MYLAVPTLTDVPALAGSLGLPVAQCKDRFFLRLLNLESERGNWVARLNRAGDLMEYSAPQAVP